MKDNLAHAYEDYIYADAMQEEEWEGISEEDWEKYDKAWNYWEEIMDKK